MKSRVIAFVITVVLFLKPVLACANRFPRAGEIGIEEALRVAVRTMHEEGGLDNEYITAEFMYNALIEDKDNGSFWYITLWPKEEQLKHLSYQVKISAVDGEVVWHTTHRYFYHYQLALAGGSFADHFSQVMSVQEDQFGPIERWNYEQYAATEELAHGWMYSGVFERFTVPGDADMSYHDALVLLKEFVGSDDQNIEVLSSCFEVYQLWDYADRYWCFTVTVDHQTKYIEIDANTRRVVRVRTE